LYAKELDLSALKNYICEHHNTFYKERNAGGMSPLHVAVKRDAKNIVNLFLQADHPTDVTDSAGHTPLHYASRSAEDLVMAVRIHFTPNYNIKCISDT